jgi:hypothetical protein
MKKRSKYRPKGVRSDVMGWMLKGMSRAHEVSPIILTIRVKNHDSLQALQKGEVNEDQLRAIIAAFNVAEGLIEIGLGTEYKDEVDAGQMALLAMIRKGVPHRHWLCTGPELKAILLAMEVHDAQLDVATVVQMEQALGLVEAAIRNRKAQPVNWSENPTKPMRQIPLFRTLRLDLA